MRTSRTTTAKQAGQFDSANLQCKISDLVDGLFRRESGRLVSILTRILGPSKMDMAEDAVQDAFGKAIHSWPFKGVPDNPSGWLMRVARNRALDIIRSQCAVERASAKLKSEIESKPPLSLLDTITDGDGLDDQLRMIFLCCHPSISLNSQISLTLKTLCGFSIEEIALGLRVRPTAVAKRVSRAKQQIRTIDAAMELPSSNHLVKRLGSVLHVLYLLFNEGYCPHTGESVVRESLCNDAIYLAHMLTAHRSGDRPETHALLALMLLQSSRLEARSDGAGSLLLLEQQDRSKWDKTQISTGFWHLCRSQRGTNLSRYHAEAGIAACHASAVSYQGTDWSTICSLYDILVQMTDSPIIRLNRVVAISMRDGVDAGMRELGALRVTSALTDYYLFHAVSAHFNVQIGDFQAAESDYRLGLKCKCNAKERDFIKQRLAGIQHLTKGVYK